jgi:L-ribulose-5-phosphate 3-epimerase
VNAIGIMQGRLSPAPPGRPQAFPWATWQDEFARAADCGLARIEWLVTTERFDENPLVRDRGLEAITQLINATGVRVTSVCADFCIAEPLVGVGPAAQRGTLARLDRLVDRCAALGATVLLVPVLEGAAIRDGDDADTLVTALAPIVSKAEQLGVRVALESDLPAQLLCDLIDQAGPGLGAYYDVGNAVSAGFDPAEELRVLGHRVHGVHIKDRHRHGASVMLGHGEVDFPPVFEALSAIQYHGPLILETPVGLDPLAAARRHYLLVEQHLHATRAVRS